MTYDFEKHLGQVERSVSSLERGGKPARAVTLTRTYDTTVDDLWDAVTSPERLPRWFAPVGGDLKLGGRYKVHGNAGGEVTACEPPAGTLTPPGWASSAACWSPITGCLPPPSRSARR